MRRVIAFNILIAQIPICAIFNVSFAWKFKTKVVKTRSSTENFERCDTNNSIKVQLHWLRIDKKKKSLDIFHESKNHKILEDLIANVLIELSETVSNIRNFLVFIFFKIVDANVKHQVIFMITDLALTNFFNGLTKINYQTNILKIDSFKWFL